MYSVPGPPSAREEDPRACPAAGEDPAMKPVPRYLDLERRGDVCCVRFRRGRLDAGPWLPSSSERHEARPSVATQPPSRCSSDMEW